MVIYRQQVANPAFPQVSDDTVQVSPLIEQIAWQRQIDSFRRPIAVLRDPFIGVAFQPRDPQIKDSTDALEFYLLDTQPVLAEARYRYFLMRFRPDGEVAQVIPAGEVEIK